MALEPAGVSLEAQGFNDYLRKLDAIEKKNREVFDTKFKGTSLSFAQVTKAARDHEKQLKKTAQAQKKLANEQKKAANEAKRLAAAQRSANIATANAAIAIAQQVLQVGKAVFELGKLGAQFEAQSKGLNNLAESFGQSGKEIQRAIVEASKGTISDLKALQVANESLLLGVARTPEEFDKFTRAALTLGRTVGISASESISRFTTALGRESLLRLDDFGAKASEVNEEIKRLAQTELGKLPEQLSKAERSAIFIEAALNITGKSVEKIGEDAASAAESFDRIDTATENLKTQIGIAFGDLNKALGATEGIAKFINSITEDIKLVRFDLGLGDLDEQIDATEVRIKQLKQRLATAEEGGFFGFFAGLVGVDKLKKTIAELEFQLNQLNIRKFAEDNKRFKDTAEDIPPVIEDNTKAIKAYSNAVRQAEQLQLSFARAAEDSAIKLARANEDLARKQARATDDIARKQAKDVAKLAERQEKERDKLLKNQQKQLDKFEKNRRKQIAKAEDDIRKARKEAGEQRKRDQRKLQNDLQRELDRFNLSRLQSERRFALSERRLRAEGDILGLQELREDFALTQQEEKENFDLSKKEQVKSAKEQQREQTKDLESRVKELKENLEDQRAELLTSFDEQLADQQTAQAEAIAQQQRGFQEAAAERQIALAREEEDRAIALAREEEDRRISQARQLQDLGISLANQKDITAEGSLAVANEIGKVFGDEGVADNIVKGFTDRTESDFKDLFDNLEDIIKDAKIEPIPIVPIESLPISGGGGFGERIGGVSEFQEGGIVPGPTGSQQVIRAHGGETVLPTHQNTSTGRFFREAFQQAQVFRNQETFRMAAPVIPTQELSVTMSGGFNISGDGQANEAILQAATQEMTENFRIAVRRLARRN